MDKTTPNRSRDEVIAGLRSCAGSVAQISQALAAQTAGEKFSFESEFLFFKREALLTKLFVPAQSQADSVPPTRPKNFEGFSGQEPDSPIRIAPVAQDLKRRPMWTVAVVASDPDPDFFPVLLASIITALAKSASWEILIADNASQTTDLAGIVREFSKFPVTVFRLETPVDPADAANECIRRSRGEFIHLPAQDGIIAEGFYEQLGNGLRKFPEAELAASHNSFCDFERVLHRPVPASELTGCYGNTNDAAIWAYRVPFSAMVARRSLYESLGGFHANLGLWAEWEMKARFLSASPIYFEKAELYFETLTSASRRQRILCEALDLELCSKAIARAAKYYPQASSPAFSETSAYLFAMEFAQFGCCLFSKDQAQAAMAHFQAAVRLCPQKVIFDTIKSRAFHLTAAQGEPMTLEDFTNGDAEELPLGDSPADFFPSAELKELETLIAAYQANPSDGAVLDQVRALRNGLCSHLLEAGDLEKLFAGNFAKIFSLVRESGLSAEDHGADEKILEGRAGELLTAVSGDPRGLLAAMLLCPAHWATLPVEFSTKPDWLMGMYMDYMLASPQGFVHFGEPDMYRDHVEALLAAIERDIAQTPLTPTAKWAAFQTALRLNLIPAYFSRRDMKDLMRARARILAFFLQQNGYQLDAAFAPRPFHRKKIRVGFLSAHLGPQTETYTSVPSFYLDREKFEIQIFVLGNNPSAIETHCRSNSDSFTVLPPEAGARVEALRRAELDVLVIGTNMTAVTNDILILGMHRLAPIQIASSSSPMTPGLPHLDGFLSGIVHGYDAYTGQYNEPLVLIDGAISCLEYSVDRPTAVKSFTRGEFGIPEGVPLFVSGANFFKILPELQATWAKILNQVPGSYLLLHPFNPNWTNRYPIARFRRDICRAFERAGVDPNRVVISEAVLPTRADVSRLMALGDVYLDSYPFSGSVSLVDPLEAGVPPVAWCAGSTRGLMAASMLSDLDLRELVAESEDEFVAKAVRLATEPGERERISRKIRSGMEAGPRFFDVKTYGREVGRVLEEIVLAERETEDVPDTGTLLARAQAALAAGRAGDTEDLCRILLERAPEDAGGWALLATLARRSGDLGYALDLTDQALALVPENAEFWSARGEICRDQENLDAALAAFQRAVELQPCFPNAWLLIAIVHDERKEADLAENAYIEALRYSRDRVETAQIRVNFAGFLRDQKRIEDGVQQLRKAVSSAPGCVETQLLLAGFLQESGSFLEVLTVYARLAKKFPDNGKIWMEWGKVMLLMNKSDEAVEKMRKSVALLPNDPDALFQLGYALQDAGLRQEALQVYLRAEAAGCDTGDLHINIGVILKDLRLFMDSADRFSKGLQRNPGSSAAMNNLGAVCIEIGLTTEAIDCFEQALRINPQMPAAYNNLGHMLKISGKAEEGIAYYRKGLELAPDNFDTAHNYLLSTLYQTDLSPQQVFEEHRLWGNRFASGIKRLPRRSVGQGHQHGKLRIAYISPDFCSHPVASFVEALLAGHDRAVFDVYAYSDTRTPDAVTKRLSALADVWRDTSEMNDTAAAAQIAKDEIDILIELCGHTAHNRLAVFAAKPAPITASYLGYPATTGMPGVDFRITDAMADPEGQTEAWHTEKLLRLSRCAWCFQPSAESPPVGPLPFDRNAFITFGCFNNLAKLNHALYDSWVEILRLVPGSHLFLKSKTLIDPQICREVREYFTSRGIAGDRLKVIGFEVKTGSHLDRYNEVDIALDSYPYHGTTTTCESLWMGVPVITRAGESHLSRVGLSLLHAVGHPELAASSEKGYIHLAAQLAQDPDRLRSLRSGLRAQMQSSPLLDAAGFISALQEAVLPLLTGVQLRT